MKINLAMIVKDDSEVKILTRCLDTIQEFVDGVYITATGEKVSEIEKLCKKRKFNYSYFKWCDDFSKARNFNFSQVGKCDYILWLDADDLFVGGEYLKEVAKTAQKTGKDGVMLTYWYACNFKGEPSLESFIDVEVQHPRERLLRPGTVEWRGRLHETPIRSEGSKDNYSYLKYSEKTPIAVMHTATLQDSLGKMNRNKSILEKQLVDEGDNPDPRTLLHLVKIYADLNSPELWKRGIEFCDKYMEKSGWDEERGVCMEYKGQLHQLLGDNDKAILDYHRSIVEYPHQPMSYLRLATAYYNRGQYRNAEIWLNHAMMIDLDSVGSTVVNFKGLKVLTSELMFKLAWNVKKDIDMAVKASDLLVKETPTDEVITNHEFLLNVQDMNNACKNLDKYCQYLMSIDQGNLIPKILYNSPMAIQSQPFAIKLLRHNVKPRKWGDNEICYFANFGSKHFNNWDGNSINKGLGGSETAVIRLSEEWTKKGYKVTVFGDPEKPIQVNGVTYLPWYYFNHKDEFNIFINWRSYMCAGKVKAKKFFIDLHDIFHGGDYTPEILKHIDKVMVKSRYHRSNAPNIPDNQITIISNGIND
jgi:tetratricopeptide (TPR) repeat protein